MVIEDIVNVLTECYARGEGPFEEDYGPGALIAMQDIAGLLKTELESQTNHGALWEAFEADPRGMAPDLSGALEALIEADPGLADKLDALGEEFRASLRSPQSRAALPGEQVTGTPPLAVRRESPVEPKETESLDHRSNAGEGTYLYGNVKGGDVTVGEMEGTPPEALPVRDAVGMLSFDVKELFTQLIITVEAHSEFSPELRAALRDELEALEAEIALGERADELRIVQHLRTIGQLDRGLLEVVLNGLGNTPSEARFIVQDAIKQVQV
jgi:hypothetical protein